MAQLDGDGYQHTMRAILVLSLFAACAGSSNNDIAQTPEAPHDCTEGWVRLSTVCVDPTGEHSASEALTRLIATLPDQPVGLGSPIRLPDNAVLRIDDEDGDGVGVLIDRRVILDGNGARFEVQGDAVAIRVTHAAKYSTIRDLTIEGKGARRGATGVDVRTHGVRLDNLWIRRVHTAVRAFSRLEEGGACETDEDCECDGRCRCEENTCANRANSNGQRWTNLVITQCEEGLVFRGGDANAGLVSGLEVLSTPSAVLDDSFLGNVYVAPLIESGTEASMRFSQLASYSTVLGGYAERNCAPAETQHHTLFVGGNLVSHATGNGERVGLGQSRLRFRDPRSNLTVLIPGGRRSALTWEHPESDGRWQLALSARRGWGFSQSGREGREFFWNEDPRTRVRRPRTQLPSPTVPNTP